MKIYAMVMVSLGVCSSAFAIDPLECVAELAKYDEEMPVGLAAKLCAGSWSIEPVKCYKDVSKVDSEIPRGIAIDLCAGALHADKTVRCYHQAGQQFNRGIATTLCGARKYEN